ncbi:long-chain acyl-CoA synthetase [Micromonospora kangleipakensis]|uniref:Long-chain acyl-CoA synthetase n=1 Tax=Micromonospora kangleipakensis TaxID=1077942 RepID=A0A4Q8BDJ8_9ACTN|nr:long-chain fatty acid--CoA ligase [Micromonospora kangleipakensis]RZU75974.1 long-chain acyl-CoA synthetase [Micromonospora kangleipakensis]
MTNLARNLAASVARDGAAPAIRFGDMVLTYAQLDEASARVAGLLRDRGVQPGDRVGIMLPNVPQFAAAYYGILRAGAVVVPMNVLLKAREVAFYLGDSQAKLVLAWHGFAEDATAGAATAGTECLLVTPGEFETLLAGTTPETGIVERDATETAVILYTSGTTGTPKGAELTHANLTRNAQIAVDLFSLTAQDIVLGALPLFHSFGQGCGLNTAITAGACLALVRRFDAHAVLDTVHHHRVTIFQGVPTMYVALLAHPERAKFDVSSLRMCASGGAALPVEVIRAFEAEFGCIILEGYGLSETSPIASFNHADRERKPGSIGTAIAGVEMALRDVENGVGEIVIRGHNVMKGYWRRPDATAEVIDADGWFRSGDLARMDDEGYFFIVDRKKDMIIRGGYNVYPREIEELLYEHPAVREVAVIGIPHPELGEEVCAAIALKDGATATPDELREHVKAQAAAYKYPRHVWIVDELPKTPTGKILKREVSTPADVIA